MTSRRVVSFFSTLFASIVGAMGHVMSTMMAFETAGCGHIIGVELFRRVGGGGEGEVRLITS
jgi:hypothetical protein